MSEPSDKDTLSRRGFLGVSSGALAAAGILPSDLQQQQPEQYSERARSTPGPTNVALDAANPDSVFPPSTDAGGVPPFKYPFAFGHKRLHSGGWSREVTVRELPISKTLAGVDMRLTAGGIRELHWHTAAEWAIMLYGTARITCIDSGIFLRVFLIRSRAWLPMAASSFLSSTTAISPNSKPCFSPIGWLIPRRRSSRRISA